VTNGQYARFIEAGGYDEPAYWTEAGWSRRERENWSQPRYWTDPTWNLPNLPVVGVSWFEALAYTRWLTEELRTHRQELHVWTQGELRSLTLEPGALTACLPTEAEWEKASRGPDGRTYPWGDEEITPDRANYDQTGIGRTSPVGCFPAGTSPYGALDMLGNVWEWCSSVGYSEALYPYRADDGREDLDHDVVRALRGGSWNDDRGVACCACRNYGVPVIFYYSIGFRVVFPGSLSDF
jgi:formylglycine-generating enzyme required for sulfatase activity